MKNIEKIHKKRRRKSLSLVLTALGREICGSVGPILYEYIREPYVFFNKIDYRQRHLDQKKSI